MGSTQNFLTNLAGKVPFKIRSTLTEPAVSQ